MEKSEEHFSRSIKWGILWTHGFLRHRLFNLVDVSDLFFGRGGEWGVRGLRGGRDRFFSGKYQEGGGGFQEREGPGGCLQQIGEFLGGGLGRNVHQVSAKKMGT